MLGWLKITQSPPFLIRKGGREDRLNRSLRCGSLLFQMYTKEKTHRILCVLFPQFHSLCLLVCSSYPLATSTQGGQVSLSPPFHKKKRGDYVVGNLFSVSNHHHHPHKKQHPKSLEQRWGCDIYHKQ